MAVNGIGGYSQEYTYQYKKDINRDVAVTQAEREQPVSQEHAKTEYSSKEKAGAGITDSSIDFKKNNRYNLVAATSEAEDIDVKKALQEMKKDAVLDRYKFFVNKSGLGTDAEGTVRIKNAKK